MCVCVCVQNIYVGVWVLAEKHEGALVNRKVRWFDVVERMWAGRVVVCWTQINYHGLVVLIEIDVVFIGRGLTICSVFVGLFTKLIYIRILAGV